MGDRLKIQSLFLLPSIENDLLGEVVAGGLGDSALSSWRKLIFIPFFLLRLLSDILLMKNSLLVVSSSLRRSAQLELLPLSLNQTDRFLTWEVGVMCELFLRNLLKLVSLLSSQGYSFSGLQTKPCRSMCLTFLELEKNPLRQGSASGLQQGSGT